MTRPVYHVIMTLTRKLTEEQAKELREELSVLTDRIQKKIGRICMENRQIPHERVAAGRHLKSHCLLAIEYLDKGQIVNVGLCIRDLEMKGLKVKSWKKLVS